MLQKILSQFVFIFDHTTHPGNLGSIARITKNMGILNVRLVNPKASHQDPEAISIAAHAADHLANFQIFSTMEEALADCNVIYATSARSRANGPKIIYADQVAQSAAQFLNPELLAGTTEQDNLPRFAVLFGTESSGLSNELLIRANYHVLIDTNPDYSSINLAMASTILAYAIRSGFIQLLKPHSSTEINSTFDATYLALGLENNPQDNTKLTKKAQHRLPATEQEFNDFITRWNSLGRDLGFIHNEATELKFVKLFRKANLASNEVQMLQGMITAARKPKSKPEDTQ